jgi:hypothetical protein
MKITPSDAPWWGALCVIGTTTGCPQLARDDFDRLVPVGTGGVPGVVDAGLTPAIDGPCAAGASGQTDARARTQAGGQCATPVPNILFASDGGPPSAPQASDGPDASAACSAEGGVRGPNGCYFVDPAETTWSEARTRCQERGASWDLATVGGVEDNEFVAALAGVEAWLGATDETTEGTWVWTATGTPFFVVGGADASVGFTNWSSAEPNDYDDSDCLRVLPTGLWADWDCDGLKGRICQSPAP